MTPQELTAVAGVPESTLDDATLARLPAAAPPAPWECRCSAVVWAARGGTAAAAAVDPSLRGTALTVLGGVVAYQDTPVGRYNEVFGAVGLRHGRGVRGSVPFMAVDSVESLVGGRQNWSLPKSLARFTGGPLATAMTATGAGWTVTATAHPIGPPLPARVVGRLAQRWPDSAVRTAVLRGRGRLRPALVDVTVTSTGPLASWLRGGRHLGVVVTSAEFTLPEPR